MVRINGSNTVKILATFERVSQSVPHLHIHIVPRRVKDRLKGFFWSRHRYHDDAEKKQIQQQISKFL